MNAIIDAAISHSRTVILSLVLLLVAGSVAYVTIPKEDSPDINIPTLYVSVVHEGISPEDAERLIIKPLEKELRAIEGVKEMNSTAFLGGANVVMEFDAGFDADQALVDVREKVDLAKPELPEDAEEPTVHEINLSLFPVLTVSLSGTAPERTLLRIARDLQDRIESISTVLEAEIVGDRDELLEVIIDPLALESYNLNASDILEMVAKSNLVVAAGSLDTGQGRFAVKVPGLFETMEDIVNLPVKVSGDAVVRFRDVASLRRTFKDSDGFSRLNGQSSLALNVSKRTGENIIETIESVRAVVEAQRGNWPATVTVAYSQDKSTDIRNNLLDLQNNVASAILLVMVVVVAALGLRSAGLVTSRGSAAHADFIDQLRRSGYRFAVKTAHTTVQGDSAPDRIAAAISRFEPEMVDMLALVRGGGSQLDLTAFDSETVARAIAAARSGCTVLSTAAAALRAEENLNAIPGAAAATTAMSPGR